MSSLSILIDAWDEAHREFAIALENFPEGDLWKRADPRLLSVGEIAGHVVLGMAIWTLGDGTAKPDLSQLPLKSPLLVDAMRYYPYNVDQPIVLKLTAEEVQIEVDRAYAMARAACDGKEMATPYPGQWRTWGAMVQYQLFHVAYHTGQAYSVRHLLGHETEDN